MRNDRFAFFKLFEIVNERFTNDYVDKPGWMYSHQWTTAQRDEYTVWLADELLRRGIFKETKEAQITACFFVHKHGWQVNDKIRKAA
jgi:hypothetical protein